MSVKCIFIVSTFQSLCTASESFAELYKQHFSAVPFDTCRAKNRPKKGLKCRKLWFLRLSCYVWCTRTCLNDLKRRYEENIKRHYPADWYSRLLKEARINVVCAATSPLIIADWRFVFHYVIRDDQYRSITLLPPLILSFHRLYDVSIHCLMAYWWLEYSISAEWTPQNWHLLWLQGVELTTPLLEFTFSCSPFNHAHYGGDW